MSGWVEYGWVDRWVGGWSASGSPNPRQPTGESVPALARGCPQPAAPSGSHRSQQDSGGCNN